MPDIELVHSAKGTSWIKRNHLWVSRKKVNGKWVYTYKTEQGHKNNVTSASAQLKKLNDETDAWNFNKKDQLWKGGSTLSDNAKAIRQNVKRTTRKSKDIGRAASKANVRMLNKSKQKAYSDYESQKRMAASAAGAATRSNQYKNAQKRRARKNKRQEMIRKGKEFIRDLITRLTNKKKYEAQQAYKKKMANTAEAKFHKKVQDQAAKRRAAEAKRRAAAKAKRQSKNK